MAISSDIRRSGPFVGTGKETVFPFSFKIISAEHVSVLVSTDGGVTEEALSPSAFTVSLNADQDNQPGGSVTLLEALGKDVRLSIVSDAPYLQPMVLKRDRNNQCVCPRCGEMMDFVEGQAVRLVDGVPDMENVKDHFHCKHCNSTFRRLVATDYFQWSEK